VSLFYTAGCEEGGPGGPRIWGKQGARPTHDDCLRTHWSKRKSQQSTQQGKFFVPISVELRRKFGMLWLWGGEGGEVVQCSKFICLKNCYFLQYAKKAYNFTHEGQSIRAALTCIGMCYFSFYFGCKLVTYLIWSLFS